MAFFRPLEFFHVFWKSFVIVLAPIILSPLIFLYNDDPQTGEAMRCAYLILLMTIFWLTESLPLPVTSMIPMIALPLLGLMSTKDVAVNYLNSTNYMFFGGLVMAIAVEHCGLHLRVALRIIMLVGTSQARLMLGFMSTTMFISMWISNTATTAMMLPIVDAVSEAINQKVDETPIVDEDQNVVDECDIREKEIEEQDKTAPVGVKFDMGKEVTEFDEDDDKTPLLIDHKEFESHLANLTHGKIVSIQQLKTLSTLEEASGHFDDDLDAIVHGHTPENTLNVEGRRKNFKRSKTLTKLQAKQVVESNLRKNKSQTVLQVRKKSLTVEKTIEQDIESVDKNNTKEETERNFLLMSIACSANIGGTGVVTGTPPNLVVPDVLGKNFGPATGLTFASWMAFAIPVMLLNLLLAWVWLQRLQRYYTAGKDATDTNSSDQEARAIKVIRQKYSDLGPMSAHEIQVLVLFILLIFLWFFKTPIFMPGWGDMFLVTTSSGSKISVASATPAILTCVLLFVLPKTYNFWPFSTGQDTVKHYDNSPSLITWRLIETKMCWGVLFLLGGGFALARALQESGLSSLLVEQLTKLNLNSLPVWVASLIFCIVIVAITNIASNTATANVLVPILSETALTMCINPIYLTLPAGIASSYAFSLPVSTAPNAIVFGHSTLKTTDMLKAGMMLNLMCTIVLVLAINTYGVLLFGLSEFPDWARVESTNCTLS